MRYEISKQIKMSHKLKKKMIEIFLQKKIFELKKVNKVFKILRRKKNSMIDFGNSIRIKSFLKKKLFKYYNINNGVQIVF